MKTTRDSVTVKIYKTVTRGYQCFFLAWKDGGKRHLKSYSNLADAQAAAEGSSAV